jgi:hypothetical protein
MDTFQMSDVVSSGVFAPERRDVLSVLWAITKGCNFKCSYCVYNKELKHTQYSSKEELLRAAKLLVRLGRPGYQITLYGGEPTVHPHFLDLLEYLLTSGAPIAARVFTNGSRSAKFFERMASIAKGKKFGAIFSLHPDFVNFDTFKRGVEITAAADIPTAVGLMFVPSRRDEQRRYIDEFLELRMKVPFYMWINHPYDANGVMGTGCSAEDHAWIKATRETFEQMPVPSHWTSPVFTRIVADITVQRQGKRLALDPLESLQLLTEMVTPTYENYYCCSGTNVMFVEEDGTARGGVCDKSRYLGSLFSDSDISFVQSMNIVRCTAKACSSIENTPLPKFKDSAEAEACVREFRNRAKSYLYRAEATRLSAETAVPLSPSSAI